MSQQFLSQARELWQTITAPETVKSYQSTLSLTWQILQRLGKTLWLGLCLVLVAFDWVGSTGISVGRSARAWLEGLQQVKTEDVASQTGQRLLASSQASVTNAITNARKQLGLAEKPTVLAALAEVMAEAKSKAAAVDALALEGSADEDSANETSPPEAGEASASAAVSEPASKSTPEPAPEPAPEAAAVVEVIESPAAASETAAIAPPADETEEA